jgi:hypothetical protein
MNKVKEESNQKTIKDPLIEPYFIGVDSYCYTIYENVTPNPKYENSGKVYIKTVGYYSTFDSCLKKISKSLINSKNYSSIKEYLIEFDKTVKQLKTNM